VQTAIESVLLGQATSDAALKAAAEEINTAIANYNKSAKG
jgi:ABC-type glycerol-3-phosphate transport system substrate-binding protein